MSYFLSVNVVYRSLSVLNVIRADYNISLVQSSYSKHIDAVSDGIGGVDIEYWILLISFIVSFL